MQLRFFTIPVFGGEPTAEELNRFLAAQRILVVERHLVQDGGASAWAICVAFRIHDPKPRLIHAPASASAHAIR